MFGLCFHLFLLVFIPNKDASFLMLITAYCLLNQLSSDSSVALFSDLLNCLLISVPSALVDESLEELDFGLPELWCSLR